MQLPNVHRRDIVKPENRVMLLHGQPLSGKTTFADELPTPLLINTVGDFNSFTAPYLHFDNESDDWLNFLKVIDLLESGDHDFESVVIDLLEDMYLIALNYFVDESVANRKFIEAINRVASLDIDNVVLLTRTTYVEGIIRTNLTETVYHGVSKLVDLMGEVELIRDRRYINFKTSNSNIRGSRYDLKCSRIELDASAFIHVYSDDDIETSHQPEREVRATDVDEPTIVEEEVETIVDEPTIVEEVETIVDELTIEVEEEIIDVEVDTFVEVDDEDDDADDVDVDFSQFFKHMDVSDSHTVKSSNSKDLEPESEVIDDESVEYAEYEEVDEIDEIVESDDSGGIEIDFSLFDQDLVEEYSNREPVKPTVIKSELKDKKKQRTRKSR